MQKIIGIPQNRERVFIISIRKDIDRGTFCFPQKEKLLLKLKDVLEEKVDNKYYLQEKNIEKLLEKDNKIIQDNLIIKNQDICEDRVRRITGLYDRGKMTHQIGSIYDCNGISPTLVDMSSGGLKQPLLLIKEGTHKGYSEATIGDSINISYPGNTTKRGRIGKEISQTITTAPRMATLEMFNKENNCYLKLRKLTPLECFRLMGFGDIDFYNAKSTGISDTQLYRQAGNSIVVNILAKILQNLFL